MAEAARASRRLHDAPITNGRLWHPAFRAERIERPRWHPTKRWPQLEGSHAARRLPAGETKPERASRHLGPAGVNPPAAGSLAFEVAGDGRLRPDARQLKAEPRG
jgi:hypothetical protein